MPGSKARRSMNSRGRGRGGRSVIAYSNSSYSLPTSRLNIGSSRATDDMCIDMLDIGGYPAWRNKTLNKFMTNNLSFTIDGTPAYEKPDYGPIGATYEELTFRQKLEETTDKLLEKDQTKRAIAYNVLYNCIPPMYQESWTKGITNSFDLWNKISEMCNYREDFLLKNFYRTKWERVSLSACNLIQVSNYENLFNLALLDHSNAGGNITMDECVAKLKKDFKKFHEYFKLILDKMVEPGDDMLNNSSTNGWTTESLIQKVKARMYIEDGSDHHQIKETPNVRSNVRSNIGTSFKSQRVKRDYNNSNRKPLRNNFRTGAYSNRDNARQAVDISFSKRNKDHLTHRPNPYKFGASKTFYPKRSFSKSYSKDSRRVGFANNITTIPANDSNTNSNSNSFPKTSNANYDVKGNNHKFKKATPFKSSRPAIGKKPFNPNGAGGGKRPYTQPYCDICQQQGHYHFQCNNYSKNKDAKSIIPNGGRTMSAICFPIDKEDIALESINFIKLEESVNEIKSNELPFSSCYLDTISNDDKIIFGSFTEEESLFYSGNSNLFKEKSMLNPIKITHVSFSDAMMSNLQEFQPYNFGSFQEEKQLLPLVLMSEEMIKSLNTEHQFTFGDFYSKEEKQLHLINSLEKDYSILMNHHNEVKEKDI